MRLTPLGLVVAQPSTKLGHLRSTRYLVAGFPAVGGLELLFRRKPGHGAGRSYSSSIWLNMRLSWMSYRTSIASGTVARLRAPRISAARDSSIN